MGNFHGCSKQTNNLFLSKEAHSCFLFLWGHQVQKPTKCQIQDGCHVMWHATHARMSVYVSGIIAGVHWLLIMATKQPNQDILWLCSKGAVDPDKTYTTRGAYSFGLVNSWTVIFEPLFKWLSWTLKMGTQLCQPAHMVYVKTWPSDRTQVHQV